MSTTIKVCPVCSVSWYADTPEKHMMTCTAAAAAAPTPPLSDEERKRLATAVAFWHGQRKIAQQNGETITVASLQGFGLYGHSADAYAKSRWQAYIAVADFIHDDKQATIVALKAERDDLRETLRQSNAARDAIDGLRIAAEAEVERLKANQRTEGTHEVCRWSDSHAYCDDDVSGEGMDCREKNCPLRAAKDAT